MESFWRKSPSEPGISVKNEIEFDVESDPEYDIMENQIEHDNMTEGELKAEVEDVQEAEVQVKSGLEAVIWIKCEPETDVEMEKETERDIGNKMEFEADQETELEFGVGTKSDDSSVRIFIVYYLNLDKNLYPSKSMFFDVLQCRAVATDTIGIGSIDIFCGIDIGKILPILQYFHFYY